MSLGVRFIGIQVE